jgi:putative membrane protein
MMMGFEVIVLVALIWFAMKSGLTDKFLDGRRSRGALEVLEERFARGEISEDEFQARKQALAPHEGSVR